MVKQFKTPFTKTQFTRTIDDIVVPHDLAEYVALGAHVARYQFSEGSYDYIFRDFVDEHTKRMVLYAEHLSLPEIQKNNLIRTLWIHDIPEVLNSQVEGSDMTSSDKIRYPELAMKVREKEEAIVEEIFSPKDKLLYEAFEPAKEMLFTGTINPKMTTPIALLARILDNFIDGTNSFHGFILDYISGSDYGDTLPVPLRDSFEYCFHRGIDVWGHVSVFSHPEYDEVKTIILNILREDFFGYVEGGWNTEVLAKLPKYAQEEYQNYRERLKNSTVGI